VSDERVIEFLRSRGRVEPPLDAVPTVMAAIDGAPEPRGWRFRVVPAVALVGGAVLLVLILTLGPRLDVGVTETPSPSGEATRSAASPTIEPSASSSAAPASLVEPRSTTEIEASDGQGPWGTITLVRGEDVGGFRLVSEVDLDPEATDASAMFFQNDPDAFYLVLEVTYRADRIPEHYGATDWLVRTAGIEAIPVERGGPEQDLAPDMPGSNLRVGPSTYSIIVPVPRAAAQEPMILIYRPEGVVAAEVPVRVPSDPPAAVASIVPPLPVPEGYVTRPGLPISVLSSETADDLFSRPDTCTNPDAGYTVTYPDDWWTNTAVGDVPACSWFSPVFFEVPDPTVVPEEVVIEIRVLTTGAVGLSGQLLPIPDIQSTGGRPAFRSEQVGVGGGFIPLGSHDYSYNVYVDGMPGNEAVLSVIAVAGTDWQIEDAPAEYILHKAILDRIMASMTFGE